MAIRVATDARKASGAAVVPRGPVVVRDRGAELTSIASGAATVEIIPEVSPVDLFRSQIDPRKKLFGVFPPQGRKNSNEYHHGASKVVPPEICSSPSLGKVTQSAILLRLLASDIAV